MQSLFSNWLFNKNIELPIKGNLNSFPAYAVLHWARKQNFTGRLGFERGKRIKYVFVQQGKVTSIQSNLDAETTDEQNDTNLLAKPIQDRLLNLLGWFDGQYTISEKTIDSSNQNSFQLDLNTLFVELDAYLDEGQAMFSPTFLLNETLEKTGELSKHSGALIMLLHAEHKATGQLLFERGQKRKAFRWSQGKITSIVTSDPKETLENTLHRWNYLPENIILQVSRRVRAEKKKLRDTLFSEKYMSKEQIEEAMAVTHAERVLEAFAWRTGSFEFNGDIKNAAIEEDTERESATKAYATLDNSTLDQKESLAPLIKLCSSPEKQTICLALPQWSQADLKSAKQIVQTLYQKNESVILIYTPEGDPDASDPSDWDQIDQWKQYLRKENSPFSFETLCLTDQRDTWSSFRGSEILHQLIASIHERYDLILWLSSIQESKKGLYQLGKTVLLIHSHVDLKTLQHAIKQNDSFQIEGFIFDRRD